jgi:hypothetical protein
MPCIPFLVFFLEKYFPFLQITLDVVYSSFTLASNIITAYRVIRNHQHFMVASSASWRTHIIKL